MGALAQLAKLVAAIDSKSVNILIFYKFNSCVVQPLL